jgi:RNA polymerase sigma-70 factor (ECF subfamily)
MSEPLLEADLVARLKAGDSEAFAQIVREHTPKLLAVARRFLRSEDDARDAVQDAFLSVHRAVHSFESGARLSTWLHRIVVNAALMKIRSRKNKPESLLDDLLPRFADDGHHADPPAPWDDRCDTQLIREQTAQAVRRAIDMLPESYRNVMMLRDIDELSTEETAQLLGITPNAVKVRLHRAHLALRTLIDTHFKEQLT